jgi:hypothetical protein
MTSHVVQNVFVVAHADGRKAIGIVIDGKIDTVPSLASAMVWAKPGGTILDAIAQLEQMKEKLLAEGWLNVGFDPTNPETSGPLTLQ